MNKFLDHLKVLPQYVIPQHGLSSIVYHITRCKFSLLKNFLIRIFILYFKVDMEQASSPDIANFPDFNHFFTRKIKSELRPVTNTGIACPVDGTISQIGKIDGTTLIQAKGRYFSLEQLVTSEDEAIKFQNGNFITLYLSPRDYHRIHMPVDGQLYKMFHVPGRLFSVNSVSTRVIKNLFSRNERVVCFFDTEIGPMAIIMVGALFVGSIDTVWAGTVTSSNSNSVSNWSYSEDGDEINLKRGDEIGRFNMGSSVIVLFGPDIMTWQSEYKPGQAVFMGSCLGAINH